MLQEHCCSGMWNKFSLLTMDPDLHSVCSVPRGQWHWWAAGALPPHQAALVTHTQPLLGNKCNNFPSSLLLALIVSSVLCSQICLKNSEHWAPPPSLLWCFNCIILREVCFPAMQKVLLSHGAQCEVISWCWRDTRSWAVLVCSSAALLWQQAVL